MDSQSSVRLEDQDESVRIAVRALGDMRNSRPAPASPQFSSSQPTPALTTASSSPTIPQSTLDDSNSPDLFARVSTIPLVNTALRAYEQSKASSRVVKYGAEMMESSVKSISRPVIDRLPVNQLDEFAHRQLDRLGRYGPPRTSSHDDSSPMDAERPLSSHSAHRPWEKDDRASPSRTPTPRQEVAEPNQQQQAVAQRSRWQAMLLEAGGLGAAMSEESMRRLKYCLHWLQYATGHIDAQILVLRDFMASLQQPSEDHVSPQHMQTLNDVKRDVVETIRQVVDIVSKYAGGALPEPARARVRGFILHLPQRWATASRQEPPVPAASKTRRGGRTNPYPTTAEGASHHPHPKAKTVSRPTSPSSSRSASVVTGARIPHHSRSSSNPSAAAASGGVPPGTANQAAQRILTLATESLDMLRGVTGVFKDSLDKAENWVERLKVVGIQRQQEPTPTEESAGPSSPSYFTSRSSFSRSSSEYYASYPPTPIDAPSPASAMDMLSIGSAATTPKHIGVMLPTSQEPDSDSEDERERDRSGSGSPVKMETDA